MKVAIIGGGAAGCFCAVELKRRRPSCDVVVLEAGKRPLAKVAVTGGGRMDDRQGDPSIIPVSDVLAGADFSCRREPLLNTLQVMLEPVGHQQRFAVRAFD